MVKSGTKSFAACQLLLRWRVKTPVEGWGQRWVAFLPWDSNKMWKLCRGCEISINWSANVWINILFGSFFKFIRFFFLKIGNDSLGSFGHVTRLTLENGNLKNELDLTPGAQWVHSINSVDEVERMVYYYASPVGKPSQKHLYKVNLEKPSQSECISCGINTPEGA